MKECIAAMPTYTFALKAQKLLHARGFPCEIKRSDTSVREGCGYSLHINGNCAAAAEVLRRYSVPFTGMSGGDRVGEL